MSQEHATHFLIGAAGGVPAFCPTRGNVRLERERAVSYVRRGPDRGIAASGTLITKFRTTWEIPMLHEPTLAFLFNALADEASGSPWTFHRAGDARLLSAALTTDEGLNAYLDGGVITDLAFGLDAKNEAKCLASIAWQSLAEGSVIAGTIEPVVTAASALQCAVRLDGVLQASSQVKASFLRDLKPAGYDSLSTARSLSDRAAVDLIGSMSIHDIPGFEELQDQAEAALDLRLSNGIHTLTITANILLRAAGKTLVGRGLSAMQFEWMALAPFDVSLA